MTCFPCFHAPRPRAAGRQNNAGTAGNEEVKPYEKADKYPPPWHIFRILISVSLAAALTGCVIKEVEPEPSPTPEPTPTATPEPTPEPTPDAPPEVLAVMDALGTACSVDMAQNIVDAFAAVGVSDLSHIESDGLDPIFTLHLDYDGPMIYAEMGVYNGPAQDPGDDPEWHYNMNADIDPDWYANTDWTAVYKIYSGDTDFYLEGQALAQVPDQLLTDAEVFFIGENLKDDVKEYLLYPNNSDFPRFRNGENGMSVTKADNICTVRSYVMASNAFGVQMETWYTATYAVAYKDTDPWPAVACLGVEFDE